MQRTIIIVGGGTAGWMTANIFAYAFQHHKFNITLIESPDINTIGVGEGSTPALKVFFDGLNIPEQEWMPACNATYKCGITFKDWSKNPGFSEYFHPFASAIDSQTLSAFKTCVQTRLSGLNVPSKPDHFFLSSLLSKNNFAPIPNYNFPFDVSYGYHFDADLLGKFLREKAKLRGVRHVVGTVKHVIQRDDGAVKYLVTQNQKKLEADLFVDCTGFASVLSEKALKVPYKSYADSLFNDAAVALPSAIGDVIPSHTESTAMKFGWAWKIPLRNRYGNGYVYSSQYCSADEAELELRRRLDLVDADVAARHIKMKVGRLENSWNHNVLAVGLSQGFIEPLEATALLLIQQTASLFAHYYIQGVFTDQYARGFNEAINHQFDYTKDYIYTHYQTNSRDDTQYWRDNRENKSVISESLARIFYCWSSGGNIEREILEQKIERYYPVSSWYCILSGMGMLPHESLLKEAPMSKNAYVKYGVKEFLTRCASNFVDHRRVLQTQSSVEPKERIARSVVNV